MGVERTVVLGPSRAEAASQPATSPGVRCVFQKPCRGFYAPLAGSLEVVPAAFLGDGAHEFTLGVLTREPSSRSELLRTANGKVLRWWLRRSSRRSCCGLSTRSLRPSRRRRLRTP